MSNETRFDVPVGSYLATFLGVKERTHEEYGPGLEWMFSVDSEPHRGKRVSRTTAPEPTMKNSCGKMVLGLAGGAVPVGADFDPDMYVGRTYHVSVEANSTGSGTRVAAVMVAPGATPAPAPAPAGPPPRRVAQPAPVSGIAPVAAPVAQRQFYVDLGPGTRPDPNPWSETDVARWLNDPANTGKPLEVCPVGAGPEGWKPAADYGLGVIPF
jgi:hypothetical protein